MTAIEFENISKQYRLGLVSTRTLSHDLKRWYAMNIQGKDDPYLKIGEVNDRAHRGESEYVWALKDINFKVEQGDVLGIIGKNGAGKSTLLKILSKVTTPSTGTIKARGRIASLLEVGTGFHPEMTGRENIYMNGAIMGMTKAEINRKFDEIVDFSGVERYIDTPAKRYSSGMTVRLGFAIAAHLDPEILVVDEVLAVGDAEFQKKAIGKMQDVSKGEGRTVLFVSHNMDAVKKLCNKGMVLQNGQMHFTGGIDETLDNYLSIYTTSEESGRLVFEKDLKKEAQVLEVSLKDEKGMRVVEYTSNHNIVIHIKLYNNIVDGKRLNFTILDKYENVLTIYRKDLTFVGFKLIKIIIPNNILIANSYRIGLAIDIPNVRIIDIPKEKLKLNIINTGQEQFKYGDNENGIISIPLEYIEYE
jgi:lipopolysaccharide transport system ATP-binding protein